MADLYNLTQMQESTNIITFFKAINDLSVGLFGIMFLIAMYMVIFLAMKNYPTKSAFMVSSFITAILTLLLRITGLISDVAMYIIVVIMAISMFIAVTRQD